MQLRSTSKHTPAHNPHTHPTSHARPLWKQQSSRSTRIVMRLLLWLCWPANLPPGYSGWKVAALWTKLKFWKDVKLTLQWFRASHATFLSTTATLSDLTSCVHQAESYCWPSAVSENIIVCHNWNYVRFKNTPCVEDVNLESSFSFLNLMDHLCLSSSSSPEGDSNLCP